MVKIVLPNYKNGSIVNLMASIAKAFGKKLLYNPLTLLSPDEIKPFKNVVLLVLDGLGYDYLINKKEKNFLNSHLRGPITSVFLPTTASAITSFQTGVATQ